MSTSDGGPVLRRCCCPSTWGATRRRRRQTKEQKSWTFNDGHRFFLSRAREKGRRRRRILMMMMTTTTTDKVTCRMAAYVAIFLVSLSTLHSASAWRNDRRKFSFDLKFYHFFTHVCVCLYSVWHFLRDAKTHSFLLVDLFRRYRLLDLSRLAPVSRIIQFFSIFLFCFCFFAQPKTKNSPFCARFPSSTIHVPCDYIYFDCLSVCLASVFMYWDVCVQQQQQREPESLKMPRTIRECKFESTASCPSPFRLSSRDNFRPCGAYIPAVVNLLPALFQEKKKTAAATAGGDPAEEDR